MIKIPECVRPNELLKTHTYYRIGGEARYFALPKNFSELEAVSDFIRKNQLKYYILGAGSNILFSDQGFDGIILGTSRLEKKMTLSEKIFIHATCSVQNIQLLRFCMSEGLSGAECLVGVPGNLGGAIFMNAGTSIGETKNFVDHVTAFDLCTKRLREISRDKLQFEYRKQNFLRKNELLYSARIKLKLHPPDQVQKNIEELQKKRRDSQPIEKPSCGSVFKNPSKDHPAWKLISNCGLRGYTIGDAQISPKHSNFIVNLGNAKSSDVISLISAIKFSVKNKFGIDLEEEVKIVKHDDGEFLE